MELIEKYLYAVGKKLPQKQKHDILKELRSIIMDNIDAQTKGEEPTQEDVTKVLLEMGAPSEVAKKYRNGPSWVIGPEYYDTYILILKIVLAATLGGYLIALIVSLLTQAGTFGARLWSFVSQLFGIVPGLFTAVGVVTIIFYIIERTAKKPPEIDFGEGGKWHPEKLEPVPQKDEVVKPVESILGIVFGVLALIIFNIYKDKLGIYYLPEMGDSWVMVKIFNQAALDAYIPLWSILWAIGIALNGWLLSIGRHNTGTRVFEMFMNALNVGILFFMANGPVLLTSEYLSGDLVGLSKLVEFFINNQHTIFTILAVLAIIGIVANFFKLIIRRVKDMQN